MDKNISKELTIKQSELLMASVIIARSTSFVVSKMTVASMEPFNILAIRFILAFVMLAILFYKKMCACSGRIIRNGFFLGITYTVVMGFEMAALQYTETSLASLIENSAFMLVPVLTLLFRHVWPERAVVIGMLLSFGGLVVLMLGQGAAFNIGCIYLIGAMCFYAFAIFQTAVYAKEGGPLLVGIVQMGTMGALSLLLSLVFESFRMSVSSSEWGMMKTGFKNAMHIPHTEMAVRYKEIPPGKPVILHCGAGVVSVDAYKILQEKRKDIPMLSYIAGTPPVAEFNKWLKEQGK